MAGVHAMPEGTRFASLPVLLDFVAAWRGAHGPGSFTSWQKVNGHDFAQRFPLGADLEGGAVPGKKTEAGVRCQIAGTPWKDVHVVDWGGKRPAVGASTDFFLLGSFAQRSPFAEIALSGAKFPDRNSLETMLRRDPALEWNRDGSLTLRLGGRRARMMKRLEKSLKGSSLVVHRKQTNSNMLLMQLLRSSGTPGFAAQRTALLEEFRDKLRSLEQSTWVEAMKSTIRAPYVRQLRRLSNPRLSDREFLARAFKELNRSPYLFTTPSMTGIENLAIEGPSGYRGFSRYEIDLSSLPKAYKRRVFTAPDGENGKYHIEIDFPFASLRDALTLAKSLRVVEDKPGPMY